MTKFLVSDQGALVGLHVHDDKSLCTAVAICATLVGPECLLSILTHLTLKSRLNPRQLLHPCQMHPQGKFGNRRSVACRDNADISIFHDVLKVGQGDLVFGLQGLFTTVFLCARLQVSIPSGYDFWYHLMSQTDLQTDDFCTVGTSGLIVVGNCVGTVPDPWASV